MQLKKIVANIFREVSFSQDKSIESSFKIFPCNVEIFPYTLVFITCDQKKVCA